MRALAVDAERVRRLRVRAPTRLPLRGRIIRPSYSSSPCRCPRRCASRPSGSHGAPTSTHHPQAHRTHDVRLLARSARHHQPPDTQWHVARFSMVCGSHLARTSSEYCWYWSSQSRRLNSSSGSSCAHARTGDLLLVTLDELRVTLVEPVPMRRC